MKRFLPLLLALLVILSIVSCSTGSADTADDSFATPTTNNTDSVSSSKSNADDNTNDIDVSDNPLDPEGYYYDVESVVLHLHTYGKLPNNYITKNEARSFGWEGGPADEYIDGAAIGGDKFGNREGLLPKADGRTYTECDIDTLGAGGRGAKRLVFSNDGLYFYTDDHYKSFTELWVDNNGEVNWK